MAQITWVIVRVWGNSLLASRTLTRLFFAASGSCSTFSSSRAALALG